MLNILKPALITLVFATIMSSGSAYAVTHTVEMLNKHPEQPKARQVFYPRVLKIAPGDTVRFVATDRGHNSASSKGMLPEGAQPWKGKIGKDIEVTFNQPGIYGYECTPHVPQGMVGLIVVEGEGMNANLEAAKSVRKRGKGKKIWAEIWQEAEEKGLLKPKSS